MAQKDYIPPNNVISPRGVIADLAVAYDGGESGGGEEGYSIAVMEWDEEKDRMGIRWNGNKENQTGNPQSRGIPTWFILPKRIEALIVIGSLVYTEAQNSGGRFQELYNLLTEKITHPEISTMVAEALETLQKDKMKHVAQHVSNFMSS